jgi:hypothetical protein
VLDAWGYMPPPQCSPCTSFAEILDSVLVVQKAFTPAERYAYLGYETDTTLAPQFGYTLSQFQTQIAAFSAGLPAAPAAASYFVTNAQSHVVESDMSLEPDYMPWLSQLVADDPSWHDVVYMKP